MDSTESNSRESSATVLPGNWLGVFGGGQLGRMFTHAAQRLGYHVAILEPEVNSPAAQAADRHYCSTTSGKSDEVLVDEMAVLCSAITLEFENIPAELVRRASAVTLTRPGVEFLEICQHRVREKSSLANAGFPTTPFKPVRSEDDVHLAAQGFGWPLVLKTAHSGYDGKGQGIVRGPDDVPTLWTSLDCMEVIAEKWIPFEAEVSMIAARNASGDIECYPLLENDHANHILDITRCPASPKLLPLESVATEICRGIAERFKVVGLFCVEFFVTGSGELMINEIAPRPHNSGHLTIEAFTCSQFEQQVRAVCNLPLIKAERLRDAAMANLLGDLWQLGEPRWEAALGCDAAHLHLYGKGTARLGRKMGHLTVLEDNNPAALARDIRSRLANDG
jgi:5-(carboxyamino)imidazole ribonucleotide synthase